jgi:hypothetical protein
MKTPSCDFSATTLSAQITQRKIFQLLIRLFRQPGEQNTLTTWSSSSSTPSCFEPHRLRLAMLGSSSSCTRANYRQRSRAQYQLSPECENSRCDFVDISNTHASNTIIPPALGGSTTTSPPIVAVILRQQLDYVYILDSVYAIPDKSYVFLYQDSIIILLLPHPILGGSAMKNHPAYH